MTKQSNGVWNDTVESTVSWMSDQYGLDKLQHREALKQCKKLIKPKGLNAKLFKKRAGVKLDLGCGSNCQPGWIGMDKRKVKGVDIVHDIQNFPWPVPDNSCFQVLMSHLWEHIEPKYRIDLMNELWRIIKKDGQLLISAPYCMSMGAFQDPTHYPCPTEATFTYFDPDHPLYGIYEPKPWKLKRNAWQANGNMEVILEPRK